MEGISITILMLIYGVICSILTSSMGVDTLSPTQLIKDGDTIISSGGMFELGFFSPGNPKNRYLGIWYKNVSNGAIVWVANRDTPLNTTSGILKVSSNGILEIVSVGNTNTTIWSSSNVSSKKVIINPVAQLLDNGNLVIREKSRTIWQSFDYPGDTYLTGMKIGKDLITGIDRWMVSWKSPNDPSPGEYVIWMDTNGFPQLLERQGSVLHTRFAPWNGLSVIGLSSVIGNVMPVMNDFVMNEKEIYFTISVDGSAISKTYLDPDGNIKVMSWVDSTQTWQTILATKPNDTCAQYGLCGPYGTCNGGNVPVCSCMEGFEPKRAEEWNARNWSSGCVPRTPLGCGDGNVFKVISGVKLPDTRSSWYNLSINLGECKMECSRNCSCTAYAISNITSGGNGCLLWFGDLMDVRESDGTEDLYFKIALSKFTIERNKSLGKPLGQGGFGSVYKGVLEDGREIAVKRLSKSSRQGIDEFKNEVRCIAKLQHRNLVKLLGYCIQGDETMLIYEYMANKSLDLTIFDVSRSLMLDWPQRFHIIHGIARGLLYLHQDSRLRVIHRDLKAANVLLDNDMNPKISDFGLARRFKGYETEANTNKVVGTYGYIAPEYAVHGLFSVKSDVFSFGVLVLEIVSGKKNRGFSHKEQRDNLLGHVSLAYAYSTIVKIICPKLRFNFPKSDHHAEDRPTMSSVVVMLDHESILPPPKQPAFYTEVSSCENVELSMTPTHNSVNNVTITTLNGR
ncbi:G-type lectin S-receptor-like serine/threonine-protein kinase At4g27290 [Bidens hawaiensis]|uniref:G-type lectin S-receptor-like serine/threonine-protein kinase At4g27290 n=1 Tax=Bidens hawaiensis TaxID=980011 RepID=UPI00404B5E10